MTGERKILTLKRKSSPEPQANTGETPLRLPRKKIIVEAAPNPRKQKKRPEPVVDSAGQHNAPQHGA